jgi:hypothetical protein
LGGSSEASLAYTAATDAASPELVAAWKAESAAAILAESLAENAAVAPSSPPAGPRLPDLHAVMLMTITARNVALR